MKRTLFIQLSCLIALLLLLAGCSQPSLPQEATATPEPLRYVNEAGGFALDLPAGWTFDEQDDSLSGPRVDLISAEDERAGTIVYRVNRMLDRNELAADLCPSCVDAPRLTESSTNGQPSWSFEGVQDDGTAQPWTIIENGDALVAFSFRDLVDSATQAAMTDSLRFSPVVDGAGRAAEMAEAMRLALSEPRGETDADVTVVELEEVTWPDACLGAPLEDEMCAAVETPGYRATIQAPDGEYVFHFDPVTTQIRLAAAPEVEIGRTQLEWRSSSFPCETILIGDEGIAFGACESPTLLSADWGSPARSQQLDSLIGSLASFSAETPAGFVRFVGEGTREATPTEQRQLAELARLAVEPGLEAGTEAAGVALGWQRDARAAGTCDMLMLYVTGEVALGSCAQGADALQPVASLTLEEIVQLYTWLDLFESGEITLGALDSAEGLQVSAFLDGVGFEMLDATNGAPLLTYAAGVFGERAAMAGLAPPTRSPPTACPEPTAATALLAAPGLGFCLLYPAGFIADHPLPGQAVIAVNSLLNLDDPRVEITVEPAAGRTLEEAIAAADVAGYDGDDPITITMAGEPAALFSSPPDEELRREALVIANDRLYRVLFTTLNVDDETVGTLDALEAQVLETFVALDQ